MARLNLENHFFSDPRFHYLIALIGSRHEAEGILVDLWFNSQALHADEGTEDKISLWCMCPDDKKIVPVLVRSGFLEELEGGKFRILGNKDQIRNLKTAHIKAVGAGKARQKSKKSQLQASSKLAPSSAPSSAPGSSNTNTNTNTNTNSESKIRESISSTPSPQFSYSDLKDIWNSEKSPAMKPVSGMSKNGERTVMARARCLEEPDPEYWRRIVKRIAQSPFCNGVNARGWVADFTFLVRPDTRFKVEEEKYETHKMFDNQQTKSQPVISKPFRKEL